MYIMYTDHLLHLSVSVEQCKNKWKSLAKKNKNVAVTLLCWIARYVLLVFLSIVITTQLLYSYLLTAVGFQD